MKWNGTPAPRWPGVHWPSVFRAVCTIVCVRCDNCEVGQSLNNRSHKHPDKHACRVPESVGDCCRCEILNSLVFDMPTKKIFQSLRASTNHTSSRNKKNHCTVSQTVLIHTLCGTSSERRINQHLFGTRSVFDEPRVGQRFFMYLFYIPMVTIPEVDHDDMCVFCKKQFRFPTLLRRLSPSGKWTRFLIAFEIGETWASLTLTLTLTSILVWCPIFFCILFHPLLLTLLKLYVHPDTY